MSSFTITLHPAHRNLSAMKRAANLSWFKQMRSIVSEGSRLVTDCGSYVATATGFEAI